MRSTPAPGPPSRSDARRAETLDMLKRSIRDLWGKRTEKKALTPEVRGLLLGLGSVYEEKGSTDSRPAAASEQPADRTRKR